MRPNRLELSGFTSFRDRSVVDFSDSDYFALVGPTGSGKSTIIDAICFALYGSVPRYDDERLVHPVITQGQLEARVRLDFSVNGDVYTAVRVARRTANGKGASTREARLERGGEVLAGTATEVTAAVTRLIGLTFGHFTKCVVLPQGQFARFLHDEPAARQELLVRLLNLGVYERMRQMANLAASRLREEIALGDRRLEEDLGFATPEALRGAKERVEELDDLYRRLGEATPTLVELKAEIVRLEEQVSVSRRWADQLGRVDVPEGALALADEISHAEKRLREAEEGAVEAEEAMAAAMAARRSLPNRDPLAAALAGHRHRADLVERVAGGRIGLSGAEREEEEARMAWSKAEKASLELLARYDAAKEKHLASHLAASLIQGDPCPVCLQIVHELPHPDPTLDLEQAKVEAQTGRAAAEAAKRGLDQVGEKRLRAAQELDTLTGQIRELDRQLASHPQVEKVTAALAELDRAEAAVETARERERRARGETGRARHELQGLKDDERASRQTFEAARDELGPLIPPSAARRDLAEDWVQFASWAAGEADRQMRRAIDAEGAALVTRGRWDEWVETLKGWCVQCRVPVRGQDLTESALAALSEARAGLKSIEKGLADGGELRRRLGEQRLEWEVAKGVGHHLSAAGFEKWLVGEALERLVQGANEIMRELSVGQYSLAVDGVGNFSVVDHHNADETRSAKTLSGGETFLASLSLALALSEDLVQLAAEGSARLEAIFLDEGFGTLDAETLEVVAATVDNLAAEGRMVGIVTHVRELADRVPLQFRVRKDARTSTIEKVLP